MADSEYVSVGREVSSSSGGSGIVENEAEVNGEKVELEMARERKVQFVRMCVSGTAFLMGVVGIWGDGA